MARIPTTAIAITGKLFAPDDDDDDGGEKSMRERKLGMFGLHEEGGGIGGGEV